jgi:hypothetical protein
MKFNRGLAVCKAPVFFGRTAAISLHNCVFAPPSCAFVNYLTRGSEAGRLFSGKRFFGIFYGKG